MKCNSYKDFSLTGKLNDEWCMNDMSRIDLSYHTLLKLKHFMRFYCINPTYMEVVCETIFAKIKLIRRHTAKLSF